jgi:hypothetical protein
MQTFMITFTNGEGYISAFIMVKGERTEHGFVYGFENTEDVDLWNAHYKNNGAKIIRMELIQEATKSYFD